VIVYSGHEQYRFRKGSGYSPKWQLILLDGMLQTTAMACASYMHGLTRVFKKHASRVQSLFDQYSRIAFSGLTDFITKDAFGKLKLQKISLRLVGQVITKIHQRGLFWFFN
jgi:hypothetical protein